VSTHSSPEDFGNQLDAVFDRFGHLCVGIDPHPYLFDRWGYEDSSRTLSEFSLRVLDACVGKVGLIKPQVAFYERWGSAGYAALERLIHRAREANILVIADAKRGDIGSTMQAYAQTWLSSGSPLESDAMTASPYLGLGSLEDTLRIAEAQSKGVFVLAATSNPEAREVQSAIIEHGDNTGSTLARSVMRGVVTFNQASSKIVGGVVIGATVDLRDFAVDADEFAGMPILAPGFGFQGADPKDARRLFGPLAQRLIVTETRSILEAGPDGINETIIRRAGLVAEALR
jgi:orotidine-5'-phosphate decarboxylase